MGIITKRLNLRENNNSTMKVEKVCGHWCFILGFRVMFKLPNLEEKDPDEGKDIDSNTPDIF